MNVTESTIRRVLIVDDEEAFRDAIQEAFLQTGHEADLASNGREALELLRSGSYDLMVTDILMPEMDGLETMMQAKAEFPELKIIAISGGGRMSVEQVIRPAEHLGADRTLSKPFKLRDLMDVVREMSLPACA